MTEWRDDPDSDRPDIEHLYGPPGADLRRALAGDEIDVQFEPVVRTSDGAVAGLEARLRWIGADGGSSSPDEIMEKARGADLTVQLDRRALSLAAGYALRHPCPPGLSWVGVPLAPESLQAPQVIGRALGLSEELDRAGLGLVAVVSWDPELSYPEAVFALSRLRTSGVRVALDRFGESPASVSRLMDLPLDFVKIDGRPSRGAAEPGGDPLGYTRALVRLARSVGSRVILVRGEAVCGAPAALTMAEADYVQGSGESRP